MVTVIFKSGETLELLEEQWDKNQAWLERIGVKEYIFEEL